MSSELWAPEQAAEYLGLQTSTLAAWRSGNFRGQPAYYKVGKLVKYRREDLDHWLVQQRSSPVSDKSENGWVMVTNKLAQRIRELDETLKLETTERARLALRVESLESERWLISKVRELQARLEAVELSDTIHDREGEQDG